MFVKLIRLSFLIIESCLNYRGWFDFDIHVVLVMFKMFMFMLRCAEGFKGARCEEKEVYPYPMYSKYDLLSTWNVWLYLILDMHFCPYMTLEFMLRTVIFNGKCPYMYIVTCLEIQIFF